MLRWQAFLPFHLQTCSQGPPFNLPGGPHILGQLDRGSNIMQHWYVTMDLQYNGVALEIFILIDVKCPDEHLSNDIKLILVHENNKQY